MYAGKVCIDYTTSMDNIGYNTAVNAASTARNNTAINVVTDTIGLGNNGGVDAEFLACVSCLAIPKVGGFVREWAKFD